MNVYRTSCYYSRCDLVLCELDFIWGGKANLKGEQNKICSPLESGRIRIDFAALSRHFSFSGICRSPLTEFAGLF